MRRTQGSSIGDGRRPDGVAPASVYRLRAELLADTRTIAEALNRPGGTYKQRRTLQTELARRRWCLIRYGDPRGELRDPEMP